MRPHRIDIPGSWWLITNRGIAKRPVFETRRDVEYFYDCIARAVARGDIEVHAFTIMTTHFHLLVRSPRGRISIAMQAITNRYVRWFNRSRRRDGPLFRGRFDGRLITDPAQFETVLRYIDRNPVHARMVASASDHPYGSARAYRWSDGPSWLSRCEVERTLATHFGRQVFDPEDTDAFSAEADDEFTTHLVEHALRASGRALPALTDLVRAASDHQQSWMEWKTALADATVPGTAFLSPCAVRRAARAAERVLRRRERPATRSDVALDLEIGLLRHAAGLSMREIAAVIERSSATVRRALRRHDLRLKDNPAYEELVLRVLRRAVRRAFPRRDRAARLGVQVSGGTTTRSATER